MSPATLDRGFTALSVRPAGEWQTYDITFRAPPFDASGRKTSNATFVRVVQNGQVIHEHMEVDGLTRPPRSQAMNFDPNAGERR